MSKNNPLRNASRKNCNYKLYKAKKQWVTTCATLLVTLGATAVTANAQTVSESPKGEETETTASNTGQTLTTDNHKATIVLGQHDKTLTVSSSNDGQESDQNQGTTTPSDTSNDSSSTSISNSSTDSTSSEISTNDSDSKIPNALVESKVETNGQKKQEVTGSNTTSDDVKSNSTDSTSEVVTNNTGTAAGLTANKAKATTSTVETTDTVGNHDNEVWMGNYRYLIDYGDSTTQTADYWSGKVQDLLPYIVETNNNEGATLQTITWTSGMTKNPDGTYTVGMNEGPDNNRFGYPTATLVVKNTDGTTTAYTGVIFNIAQTIASYIRGKLGIDVSSGNETAVLSDAQAAATIKLSTHVNSTADPTKANIYQIIPNNWTYGGAYLQSIISSVEFTGDFPKSQKNLAP